ncbi:MAG: undecaprenyl-diphosphatase UppP [Minisyncoccia bacterium]
MTYLVAIVLGFVQGATEFIPVSSSGHLIIARQILGENSTGELAFDAILQLATTLAVLVYFRKDIREIFFNFWKIISGQVVNQKEKILIWSIVLGTLPAVIFGLLLESKMETVFRNTHLVALTLVLGSILFWFAQKVAKQNKELSLGRGIVIGFFQCLALVPGISRSGATISGGFIADLKKEDIVRFSFLLSIPILLGTGLKKLLEVRHELFSTSLGTSLLLGSVVAFITGFFAIDFLIKYLKNHDLDIFILYRIALSIAIFLLF